MEHFNSEYFHYLQCQIRAGLTIAFASAALVEHGQVITLTTTATRIQTTTTTTTTTATSSTTNTSICIFPGQPLGAFVRVLNDSNSKPIAGAEVTATRDMTTACGGSTEAYTTVQEKFTTNNTEWYSMSVLNGGTYQIKATYLGHAYDLSMPLGLSIYNCGTLYLPSGETNVTTSTQMSCASALSTTTMVTTTCSPAATQENPLLTFRINVQYNGPWNATAIGYSNTTANQAFQKCYSGNGNGWIQIADWNPNGSAILNLTVQKMDASTGNLTAIGNGQVRSTAAPYGAVTISLTAVP